MLALLCMWLGISVPLVFLGYYFGFRMQVTYYFDRCEYRIWHRVCYFDMIWRDWIMYYPTPPLPLLLSEDMVGWCQRNKRVTYKLYTIVYMEQLHVIWQKCVFLSLPYWTWFPPFCVTWRSDDALGENVRVWTMWFCCLRTFRLEWSATDSACIVETVPE